MAERLTLSTIFNAGGNLPRKLRENGRAIARFANRANQRFRLLNRGSRAIAGGFRLIANRVGLLATAVAGAAGGRFLLGLEERFTRLGIQSNKTDEQMARLRETIFDISQAPDIRITPESLTSAVEKIVEKTGDLEFAKNNLRNIAAAIQASGAQGQDIGGLVAEFKKLGITTEQDVLVALDTLVTQGKAGAFTLQNLAAMGERAVSAFAGMGFTGQDAVQAMGALLQVSRMGTGSAEQATTAFEALLRTIVEKGRELHEVDGITIFDPDQLAKGVEQFRPMQQILDDIIRKAEGKSTVLNKIFGAEAGRALNVLAAEFKTGGTLQTLEDFLKIQGDGAALMQDSARAANTAAASIDSYTSVIKQNIDEKFTGPMKSLVDLLNDAAGVGASTDPAGQSGGPFSGAQDRVNVLEAPEAKLKIEIDQAGQVRVRELESQGLDIEVDSGRNMEAP